MNPFARLLQHIRPNSARPQRPIPTIDPLESRLLFALGDRLISITDAPQVVEGNRGLRYLIFHVELSGRSATAITVSATTADGSAKSGSDYVSTTQSITFAPDHLRAEFVVPVNGDKTIENNESVLVNLSAPTGATLGRAQGIGRIVDDDRPTVSVHAIDPRASEIGSNPGLFRISRTLSTSAPLTVTYTLTGSAKDGTDFTKLPGSLTIPAGQSFADITIAPLHDTLVEGTEDVVLKLTNSVSASVSQYARAPESRFARVLINDGENTRPTAELTSHPTLSTPGVDPYSFTVHFADNDALNLSSITSAALQITGPNAFSQNPSILSITPTPSHNAADVIFSVSPPAGSWDTTDNGTYTITLVAATSPKDRSGNPIAGGSLGTFSVQI